MQNVFAGPTYLDRSYLIATMILSLKNVETVITWSFSS